MTGGSAQARQRLFVAAELPDDVHAAVRRWQRDAFAARADLRRNDSLHLTLSFLGDQPADSVPRIVAALAAIERPTLAVEFGPPVFLPRRGRKTVVALGIDDPSGALVRLQAEVSEALVETGVLQPQTRAFLAHLTVARFRRPGQAFSLQNVNVKEFCLPSVILYSSVLEKGGAVHTPLATFLVS